MDWYFASLRMYSAVREPSRFQARNYHYLITADGHDDAYQKSIRLGNSETAQTFAGVEDLLLISDPPQDKSELSWSECELSPAELYREVSDRSRMRVFLTHELKKTGWYVGSVVLQEVHDQGSHGERILVWVNSYLVSAENRDEAHEKVVQIGRAQQDGPGSHLCDGEEAHWEFKGIKDIVALEHAPANGALLWCDDTPGFITDPSAGLPDKSDLSLFKWAAKP